MTHTAEIDAVTNVTYVDGAQALKSAGQNADIEVVAGVDHFDLVERLTAPDYSLSQVSPYRVAQLK